MTQKNHIITIIITIQDKKFQSSSQFKMRTARGTMNLQTLSWIFFLIFLPQIFASSNFINTVHNLSPQLSKHTEVKESQVVWSPYSIVNILPLIDSKYDDLRGRFLETLDYFEKLPGINFVRFSVGFSNEKLLNETGLRTEIHPFENLTQVEEAYTNYTGFPPSVIPQISPSTKNIFITSLNLIANWEFPFFRRKSNQIFFINETHAIKTKYLNSVGYFKYADLDEIDAKAVGLPFNEAEDIYFIVIIPNSKNNLKETREKLNSMKMTQIWRNFTTEKVKCSIPLIEIDNHLLFTIDNETQVVHYSSIRLRHSGIESHFTNNIKPTPGPLDQLRKKKNDIKFKADRPFIFMVYDSLEAGILNYGEVLLPHYYNPEENKLSPPLIKLSPNANVLKESVNSFGQKMFSHLQKNSENLATAPLMTSMLLGTLIKGADEKVQKTILAKLNFPQVWDEGLNELSLNGCPGRNVTVVNSTMLFVEKELKSEFKESGNLFGTILEKIKDSEIKRKRDLEVVTETIDSEITESPVVVIEESKSEPEISLKKSSDEYRNTTAVVEYNFNGGICATKSFYKQFFLNERDFVNTSFIEFRGRVKRAFLSAWQAEIFQIPIGEDGKQTILMFVPNLRSGIHLIEANFEQIPINEILCKLQSRNSRIFLPEFTIETETDLMPHLHSMEILNNEMIFDKIGENVKISKFIQKVTTKIHPIIPEKIRKEGRWIKSWKKRGLKKYSINRPFIYYIYDQIVGTLAVGKVVNANKDAPIEILKENKKIK